jgi:hypothetical protein
MGIPFQETIFETNLLNLIVVIYVVVTVVGEALTRELETRQKKIRERYENSLRWIPAEEPMTTQDSPREVKKQMPDETYAKSSKEKKRIRQIENEHSKRIIQARYQQTALVRSRIFVHRKKDLKSNFSDLSKRRIVISK